MQIQVVFCGTGVVKVSTIRLITAQIPNKETLTGLILIIQNEITSQALKGLDLFKFKVEVFRVCIHLYMYGHL